MRRRIAGRTLVTAAVGTTLAISLTGCLGESGDGGNAAAIKLTAADALVKSSEKTGQADSFKADITLSDSDGGGTKVRASGSVRLRPTLAFSATLDELSRGGQSLPFTGSQAILTGNTVYAKVPKLAQFVGIDKPWVKVDLNQVSKQAGFDLNEVIATVQKINPAEQTKMLTGSKDARRVGTESLDGVKTTHYTGTVTVQDALNRLDPAARDKVRQWHPDGSGKINFDLWVDKDQLPRKLVTKGAEKGGGNSAITVQYKDYGKKVSVNAPPSDQVGDISGRLGQLFGN